VRAFALFFVGLALYGALLGFYGATLISAVMAVFMVYAEHELKKRDEEFHNDPNNARKEKSTLDILRDKDSEAGRSTF